MSLFDQNLTAFRGLKAAQQYTDIRSARTGGRADDGTIDPNPITGLAAGYIWIREGDEGERGQTRALIIRVRDDVADLPIWIGQGRSGELCAIEPRIDTRSLSVYGGTLAGLGVPRQPVAANTQLTDTTNIIEGRVRQSDVSGLTVTVEGFWYNGVYIPQTVVDVSANVPGTTAESCWVLVYYTPSSGVFTAASGTADGRPASAFQESEIASISVPAGSVPLGAFVTTNGDAAIANTNFRNGVDVREWLAARGGMVSFTAAGDSGSSQTVSGGDTLTIAGGVGLASVASATDTITLNLDVNSLTADASPDGAADYVVTYDASATAHKKVLLDDLPGGAGGGASTALNNLASVAVNTSLISDTDNTDDLGSTGTKWKTTYSTNVVVEEQTAPATPASGDVIIYAKTDGKVYSKDDAGTEYDLTAGSGSAPAYPKRATLWHDESTVITGNAIATDTSGSGRYTTRAYQNAPAINDEFTNGMYLEAGTYTLSVLGQSNTNCGQVTWYIDGVSAVSAQDWYAASGAFATKTASVTVSTDGWHVLKGIVAGKHASSSNYFLVLVKMWFKQASD